MKLKLINQYLGLAILIACMAGCVKKEKKEEEDRKPNILLLMADNQSWNHVGCYGDNVVRTPNMDKIANQGVRFTNMYCNSPSCTPARGSLLTGLDIWNLEEGANLWGILPKKFVVYTDLLEQAGYRTGYSGKGWAPGSFKANGRPHNPAGRYFEPFKEFIKHTDGKKPWTYWFSSYQPGRPFDPEHPDATGFGRKAGIDLNKIKVPGYLPDSKDVREDIADYYAMVEKFDNEIGEIMTELKNSGQLDNTVIVVCSDNGWQMPRGLANLYDFGTHVPFIVSWPGKFKANMVEDNLVTLNDIAPTFLELAGVKVPDYMTSKSLLPFLGKDQPKVQGRPYVVFGRERHAFVRQHGLSYPGRAIRNNEFLYIKNNEPTRWPAGDPPLYGDVDPYMMSYEGLTKFYLMANKENPKVKPLFDLAFAKRPAEELYDVKNDPNQMHNLANDIKYSKVKAEMAKQLKDYLIGTKDPREIGGKIIWDNTEYFSEIDKTPTPNKKAQKMFNLKPIYNYLN